MCFFSKMNPPPKKNRYSLFKNIFQNSENYPIRTKFSGHTEYAIFIRNLVEILLLSSVIFNFAWGIIREIFLPLYKEIPGVIQ